MKDLELLQKHWEKAYEAIPKLYDTPDEIMLNFTLSENVNTILFKKPWENFKLEDEDKKIEWRLGFFSISRDKPFNTIRRKKLIKTMNLKELKNLGLKKS